MTNENIISADKDLLNKIANNDENAFSQFFKNNYDGIYTIALRLTQSESIAKEILQEIFLKIWMKRAAIPEIENFNAYIYVTIQNTVYTTLKKQAKEKKVLNELRESMYADYQDDVYEESGKEAIWEEAVNSLPEKQRKAYELVKRRGMRREQAAKELNVSAETIKSNLQAAINNIRAFVKGRSVLIFCLSFMDKFISNYDDFFENLF